MGNVISADEAIGIIPVCDSIDVFVDQLKPTAVERSELVNMVRVSKRIVKVSETNTVSFLNDNKWLSFVVVV